MHSLLNQLTLSEKLQLLSGKDMWHTLPIHRLGLNELRMSDGPHGVRKMTETVDMSGETIKSVAFPTLSALATTWNPDLAYQMGEALADECHNLNVDILLGPGVNIKRTPLCGRNFEYFSEDPYLAGKMAAYYIRGLEEHGTATSLKHFAANNQEFGRTSINVEADLRTLHEIYFKPFEIAIKEGHPSTVMCAYNKLFDAHCSANKWLLSDILRDTLHFEGIVISDWWAVHDRTAALKAGLELQMPYTEDSYSNLMATYEKGDLTIEEIDNAADKLLAFIEKRLKIRKASYRSISLEEKHGLAKNIAAESMVLLKNKNNLLPIDPNKVQKVALIGEYAHDPFIQGGGSSKVNPLFVDSTLERMQELAPDNLDIQLAGVYSTWMAVKDVENVRRGVEAAKGADMAIVFVGNGEIVEKESIDREHIRLSKHTEILIREVAKVNPHTVVVMAVGSAIDTSNWIDQVEAVILQGYAGGASGSALADLLMGKVCPSGKLTETYPLHLEDCPAYEEAGNGMLVQYKEGIMVGYRYYDTYEKEVAFPFGHGLSYTSFDYHHLAVTSSKDAKSLSITCDITNTGSRLGKETAQLYVHYDNSFVSRPMKELKGFTKVLLQPGETQTIHFTLPLENLAYYDVTIQNWVMNEKEITLMIGASSRDLRLTQKISL